MNNNEMTQDDYKEKYGALVRISSFWKTRAKTGNRTPYQRSANLETKFRYNGEGTPNEIGCYLQIRKNQYAGDPHFSDEPDLHLMVNEKQIDGLIGYLERLKENLQDKRRRNENIEEAADE